MKITEITPPSIKPVISENPIAARRNSQSAVKKYKYHERTLGKETELQKYERSCYEIACYKCNKKLNEYVQGKGIINRLWRKLFDLFHKKEEENKYCVVRSKFGLHILHEGEERSFFFKKLESFTNYEDAFQYIISL